MSIHIFGNIVTHTGIAANNRGENEGNITTLQKLLWNGEVHTTVSAEAIRWAVRYHWQTQSSELPLRRRWNEQKEDYLEASDFNPEKYIDDDVLGFMKAEAAKSETNTAEHPSDESEENTEPQQKKKKPKTNAKKEKGTIDKRRGVLEVCRAVSLDPYAGDITFNARAGTKGSTSLYGTEIHATRYQYGFALTPNRLYKPERAQMTVRSILELGEVAGNHSRFLYDFSPESVILRITHDPSHRLLYCFTSDGRGHIQAEKLRQAIESRDVLPEELVVGGAIADTELGSWLIQHNVPVFKGVRQAGNHFIAKLA